MTSATPQHPFHATTWPRSIIHPEDYSGGDQLVLDWDLGAVEDKDKKRLIQQWCVRLPRLQHMRGLYIWSRVTQPLFDAACQLPDLERLCIKWSSIQTLDAIRALKQLRYLHIGSSTKIESIEPLAALTGLKFLELENFKLIDDFSPLLALRELEVLRIGGSMWSKQNVGSLEPFGQMTWLKSLTVDTSHVESLRPLANLKQLRGLETGGRWPMADYAWLAAQLPDTDCRWFKPWNDLTNWGIGRCKQCQQQSMVMLTGKGAKNLCLHCDREKVQRHETAFMAIKNSAMLE